MTLQETNDWAKTNFISICSLISGTTAGSFSHRTLSSCIAVPVFMSIIQQPGISLAKPCFPFKMLSTLRTGKSNGEIWLLAVHQRCSTDVLGGYELQQSNLLTGFGTTARYHTEMLLIEGKKKK